MPFQKAVYCRQELKFPLRADAQAPNTQGSECRFLSISAPIPITSTSPKVRRFQITKNHPKIGKMFKDVEAQQKKQVIEIASYKRRIKKRTKKIVQNVHLL